MDSPAYIGEPDIESPKHLAMDEIVEKELGADPSRKMLIFCRYRKQVEEYLRRYASFNPCAYYGGLKTDSNGYMIDHDKKPVYFKVDSYGNFVLDQNKNFIP